MPRVFWWSESPAREGTKMGSVQTDSHTCLFVCVCMGGWVGADKGRVDARVGWDVVGVAKQGPSLEV